MEYLSTENERDFLLSVVLSLDTLAKAGKLTNENVHEVTTAALRRIEPRQSSQVRE